MELEKRGDEGVAADRIGFANRRFGMREALPTSRGIAAAAPLQAPRWAGQAALLTLIQLSLAIFHRSLDKHTVLCYNHLR